MWILSWQFPFRNKNWKQIVLYTKQRDGSSAGMDWYYQMNNTHSQERLWHILQQLPSSSARTRASASGFRWQQRLLLVALKRWRAAFRAAQTTPQLYGLCTAHFPELQLTPGHDGKTITDTSVALKLMSCCGEMLAKAASRDHLHGGCLLKEGCFSFFLSKPRSGWSPAWKLQMSLRKY